MIEIKSTPAKIGISTRQAHNKINQQKAEVSIEQPKAKLNISTTPSRLSIDQSKAWRDMDLKNVLERTREFAEQGNQDWLSGLARMAQQGDQLMKIENNGNPIVEQAKENSKSTEFQFGYGTLPKTPFRVELDYKPAQVNIEWERNEPIINVKPQKPDISYTQGSVDIYLRQHASLSIDFEPKIDQLG